MKRVNFHLSEPQIDKLYEISKELDISVAEIIRRAIDDYLKQRDINKCANRED